MKKIKFKRILLKLSGEALKGKREYGIDPEFIDYLAKEIKPIYELGVQIAIVTGGGNIFRGLSGSTHGMDRSMADYMGMLATIFNSIALQDSLEKNGIDTRLLTTIEIKQVAEPFIRRRAIRHMEKGRIVILGGGTGIPYITTDTTAVLRCLELKCDIVIKATKVDGIYTEDPNNGNNKARMFKKLSFARALSDKKINIMDKSALALCSDNNIPIIVYNMHIKGNLTKILLGQQVGTTIQ
ncbi:UMP kinase [Candidatus Daviesbacteria bacterium]|nr:UMP kinase [Candidatus Daviesbacteria bacterium]